MPFSLARERQLSVTSAKLFLLCALKLSSGEVGTGRRRLLAADPGVAKDEALDDEKDRRL